LAGGNDIDHVAIMKKSWGLTKKILTGEKKIESRWYKTKYAPWDKVKAGDTIYFKDSGEPVTVRAEVEKIMQFSDLSQNKVKEVLDQYGMDDGIGKERISEFFLRFKDKKYCMQSCLKNPQEVTPFDISKKGFGAMASWIIVKDINSIKVHG